MPERIAHAARTFAIELIGRLAFALLRLSWSDFTQTLRAYGMLYRDLPKIISTSRRLGRARPPASTNPQTRPERKPQ